MYVLSTMKIISSLIFQAFAFGLFYVKFNKLHALIISLNILKIECSLDSIFTLNLKYCMVNFTNI